MTDIDRVWDEIADHHACMLVDRDAEGLRARPMAPYVDRQEGTILFVTDARYAKDEEIRANPDVCLAFADEGGSSFLSVSGKAEVLRDTAKLKAIWDTSMEAFFPEGPESPYALLVKVRPSRAELWQGDGRMLTAIKAVAGALSHERPDLGEARKVRLA